MKKQALVVIASKNFQDREFIICKRILEKQEVSITIASKFLGLALGMLGNKVMVDILLPDVVAKTFDALIFIGGQGAVDYVDDYVCHQIIEDFLHQKKIIAAISIAPAILAQAGILKNKKATVWASELNRKMIKIFKEQEVIYQEEDVVVDKKGKIVTANAPAATEEFTKAILQLLEQSDEDDLDFNIEDKSGQFLGKLGYLK